jgi:hypothetical protein
MHCCRVLPPPEGRYAIVTSVGSGMRWTLDVARRAGSRRTAKSCGPDLPTLGSSLVVMIREATEANKPGTPRRARIRRKPLRREGMFRRTCGDCRLRFLLQAGHGCGQHPAFLAPSIFSRDNDRCITRAFRAAGMLNHIPPPSCPASSSFKRGIQYSRGFSVKHCRLWNTGSPGQAGR